MEKTITINYWREMRNLVNKVKQLGLNSSGILYGGVVRDDIIGMHYRNLFIEKKLDFANYWNDTYDEETKGRLIMPKDIDIFFKGENNSNEFINNVSKFVKGFNGSVVVSNVNHLNHFNYVNNYVFLKHKKIHIRLVVGATLIKSGVTLTLNIDLIEVDYSRNMGNDIIYNENAKSIEPPFYNVDFLSNIFIMEKSNTRAITRISNCTGTPIDGLIYSAKIQLSSRIINDIINFKTQFVNSIDTFNSEYVNCYRILKMVEKRFPWNITNIPFKFLNISDITVDINEKCCICLDEIIVNDTTKEELIKNDIELVELNSNVKKVNYFHKNCFLIYLRKEHLTRYVDDITKKVECRCPFRNKLNFRYCYREVEYI